MSYWNFWLDSLPPDVFRVNARSTQCAFNPLDSVISISRVCIFFPLSLSLLCVPERKGDHPTAIWAADTKRKTHALFERSRNTQRLRLVFRSCAQKNVVLLGASELVNSSAGENWATSTIRVIVSSCLALFGISCCLVGCVTTIKVFLPASDLLDLITFLLRRGWPPSLGLNSAQFSSLTIRRRQLVSSVEIRFVQEHTPSNAPWMFPRYCFRAVCSPTVLAQLPSAAA